MIWCIYAGIALVTFVVSSAFAIRDTFVEHRFYKDVFDKEFSSLSRAEDYLWDFCLALVLAILWPLFLIGLICGGMTWPFL